MSAYCLNEKQSEMFINYITSNEGKEIFKKHGYLTNIEEVSEYWHQGVEQAREYTEQHHLVYSRVSLYHCGKPGSHQARVDQRASIYPAVLDI